LAVAVADHLPPGESIIIEQLANGFKCQIVARHPAQRDTRALGSVGLVRTPLRRAAAVAL
jgi:hypothetical protein